MTMQELKLRGHNIWDDEEKWLDAWSQIEMTIHDIE